LRRPSSLAIGTLAIAIARSYSARRCSCRRVESGCLSSRSTPRWMLLTGFSPSSSFRPRRRGTWRWLTSWGTRRRSFGIARPRPPRRLRRWRLCIAPSSKPLSLKPRVPASSWSEGSSDAGASRRRREGLDLGDPRRQHRRMSEGRERRIQPPVDRRGHCRREALNGTGRGGSKEVDEGCGSSFHIRAYQISHASKSKLNTHPDIKNTGIHLADKNPLGMF
jgi:hypothetical protein